MTYMTSVEDPELKGGGYILKQHVWNAARDTISEWTGVYCCFVFAKVCACVGGVPPKHVLMDSP